MEINIKIPTIMSVSYRKKKCPNCGGKIYNPCIEYVPFGGCTRFESCDEGGGTTGYIVICNN